MRDEVLEYKVVLAVAGNRLMRLDNPIMASKLRGLKHKAEQLAVTVSAAQEE